MEYETSNAPTGFVTITKHYVVIGNILYNIHSEQLSTGAWKTYSLQEVEKYIVHNSMSDKWFLFTLYRDHYRELPDIDKIDGYIHDYYFELDSISWLDYYNYIHYNIIPTPIPEDDSLDYTD